MTKFLSLSQIGLNPDQLSGKVAVVSGAGRGIGKEAALGLAWCGARVVIAEIFDEGLQVEAEITAAGGSALFVRTDVSEESQINQLVNLTHKAFGKVDILINNAMICPVVSVMDMETALWEKVLSVNLSGTFRMTRAFLPDMVSRKTGTIINMISTDAMPGLSAYIASKQGLVGFTQSLAAEVGQYGVQVVAFAPGMVDTPGIHGVAGDLAAHLGMSEKEFLNISIHPAYPGLMPVEHAAAATVYLAGVLAREYHGEVVNGYEILERGGVISEIQVPPTEAAASVRPVGVKNTPGRIELIQQGLNLSRGLVKFLEEIRGEFDKLPVFARPIARSGFKSKAGISIQEWIQLAENTCSQLEEVEGLDRQTEQELRDCYPRLKDLMGKLILYLRDVPKETARFTRDEDLLRQVSRLTAQRESLIRSLMAVLDTLLEV
jgi:NAD(P)-dependent dehydrogenase (short-subunit alcohol dehydrogenase family)